VQFADGTRWNVATLRSMVVTQTGTASADTLVGWDGRDSIDSGAGNDVLSAGAGNDSLNGGAGNDRLVGGEGNDVLDGGSGNDVLEGGGGNDTYSLNRGGGTDSITDSDVTTGNTDVLQVGAGVTASQLWFRRTGTDLEVSIVGSTDRTMVTNWYADGTNRIEQFRTADGKTLIDSRVDALVTAMAAFAPPAAGQTTLPQTYQTALNPVIAANWR
jgi:Ca2+-binding RTX toxin-like protein